MKTVPVSLPPRILSVEPFVPHTLEHLTQARVFPNPLPEVAYNKMLADYAALSDVSVWRIVYDSDGLKVTGLMALPKQVDDAAHPVVVYNRGGSREYGKLTLYTVMRSLVPMARKGALVFASNYRGNDGSEGQEEFGGRDLNDVLNLLDIARNHVGFDRKNAYMVGHSRGGMMTTLALKAGAPVNAAISIAGIADARELLNYPNILNNVLKPLVPGFHDDQEAALHRRSSVLWPHEIDAPLLLLHGDNDKDVHVNDSIRLDKALKAAGKTSELVIYPTSSHALVRSWDDVMQRSFAWMEKHRA